MNQEKLNQRFREQVLNGSLITAENLFAQGANPDYVYPDGKTLLGILAEREGDLDKIKFLVETCRADPRVKGRDGKMPSEVSVFTLIVDYLQIKAGERESLLFDFVQDILAGRFREAREKFSKGANPNEGYGVENLDFVLLDACDNGKLPAIRLLIEEFGVDPHILTKGGKTILETIRDHAISDCATDHERRVLKCLEDAIWRKEHPFLARFLRKPTGDELIVVAPSTAPVVPSGQTHVGTVVVGPTPPISAVAPPKRWPVGAIGRVAAAAAIVVAAFFLISGPTPRPTETSTEPTGTSASASASGESGQSAKKKDSSAPLPEQATKPQPPVATQAPKPATSGEPPKPPLKLSPLSSDAAKVSRDIGHKIDRQAQERAALDACRKSNRPVCVMPKR